MEIILSSLPASIKCLSKLRYIILERCKRLEQLPDLPSNDRLEVRANDSDSLKMLSEPSQQGRFTDLYFFRLITVNCLGLTDDEGLNNIFNAKEIGRSGDLSVIRSCKSWK